MNKQQREALVVKQFPELKGQKIEFKRVSGLTNITFAVWVNSIPRYIFKQFTEGWSHDFEHQVLLKLSREGMIPEMFFADKTYRIDQFVQNSWHPKHQQIVQPPILKVIMTKMSQLHKIDILFDEEKSQTLSNSVFNQKTYNSILDLGKKDSPCPNYTLLLNKLLEILKKRQSWAQYLLPKNKKTVCVCHNDLNNLNILVTAEDVFLIDYDYTAFNYQAYDISNLINQTSLDYSPLAYPGFTVIKVYTEEELSQICKHYPNQYPELNEEVVKFMCVCNLYWAIWSIQRSHIHVSEIFGILEHGLARMQLFESYLSIAQKKYGKFSDLQ